MVLLIFYIFVCALVGIFGMRLRGGFFLYFLVAILFTPFIAFIIAFVIQLLSSRPAATGDIARERCDAQRPLA